MSEFDIEHTLFEQSRKCFKPFVVQARDVLVYAHNPQQVKLLNGIIDDDVGAVFDFYDVGNSFDFLVSINKQGDKSTISKIPFVQLVFSLERQPENSIKHLFGDFMPIHEPFGGYPLLLWATRFQDYGNVVRLLDLGADVRQTDNVGKGQTALMLAAQGQNAEIVKFLGEQPMVEFEREDVDGNTALFHACDKLVYNDNDRAIIDYLMRHGNVHHKNRKGETPFKKAEQEANFDVERWARQQMGIKVSERDIDITTPNAPYFVDMR